MDETIRTFIAIELSKEIRQGLGALQEKLKKSNADVRWVKPDSSHLTLKFLGNISTSLVEPIKEVLDGIARETAPFQIALSKIGAFPIPRRAQEIDYPRVIWVGLEEEKNEVSEIREKLEERLEKIGLEKETRPFHPHLTLGRVKSSKNKAELKKSVEELNKGLAYPAGHKPTAKMIASEIKLLRSTLTPKGAIYTCLCQSQLGK